MQLWEMATKVMNSGIASAETIELMSVLRFSLVSIVSAVLSP